MSVESPDILVPGEISLVDIGHQQLFQIGGVAEGVEGVHAAATRYSFAGISFLTRSLKRWIQRRATSQSFRTRRGDLGELDTVRCLDHERD